MLKPYIYSLTARLHNTCDTSWNSHSIPSAPIDLEPNTSTMSTNKVLQSSVLSLQSDVPFFLGRKASKASTASTTLDPIAVAQLKARAIAANKQKEASLAKAAQVPAQSQYQTRSAPSPHWTRIPHGVDKRGSSSSSSISK